MAAPTVVYFAPGVCGQGHRMRIEGSGFSTVDTVELSDFDFELLTPAFEIESDSLMYITVPSGAAIGEANLFLENPDGNTDFDFDVEVYSEFQLFHGGDPDAAERWEVWRSEPTTSDTSVLTRAQMIAQAQQGTGIVTVGVISGLEAGVQEALNLGETARFIDALEGRGAFDTRAIPAGSVISSALMRLDRPFGPGSNDFTTLTYEIGVIGPWRPGGAGDWLGSGAPAPAATFTVSAISGADILVDLDGAGVVPGGDSNYLFTTSEIRTWIPEPAPNETVGGSLRIDETLWYLRVEYVAGVPKRHGWGIRA